MKRALVVVVLVALVAGGGFAVWWIRTHRAADPTQPPLPGIKVLQNAAKASPNYIAETVQMLQADYVEAVDTAVLMKGARDGLAAYLKTQNVSDPAVGEFDPAAEGAVQTFISLLTQLASRHTSRVSEEKLVYASLQGMMGALKDPYSVAMDSKEYKELTEQMSGGNFGGIGVYIQLDKKDKLLTISETIEDTPAAKAGLKPGDTLLKVNGETTRGMDLDLAASKIRGPDGTSVKLVVQRKGEAPKEILVLREFIHVKSASSKVLEDGIGYVKLRRFGQDTDAEFSDALESCRKQGARAVILDLRNNGGGYIKAALDVCSKFLPRGTLAVSVVNYRKNHVEPNTTYGKDPLSLPIVVLVNGYSASASEITAGAIQDTGVGILVGTPTFGKGSVQTIHELSDGGAVKFTIAHYLTPKGRNINHKGIDPDITVKLPADKVGQPGDAQLEAAMEYLRKKLALEKSDNTAVHPLP